MVKKLTRQQIKDGLDQIPVEVLLSSGKGKTPALTTKQKDFARAIALGKSKAQAYRETHKGDATKNTLSCEPYRLASNPRIATEVEAYKLALEAEKHRTPAQLKALLVQQLVQHSLDGDFPPAQRVQCLKLLGSLFEVGAFIERKEIITINKSSDIKARLLQVLGSQVVDADIKPVSDDGGQSLLAELEAGTPEDSQSDDPNHTPATPFDPSAWVSDTHSVSDKQSQQKSTEDSFDSP
jgi:hypothetical protein